MRMTALLEEAARQEAADLAEAEAGYAAARKAQSDELAARQAEFIEWLGDLADDLTIQPAVLDGDGARWQIRPRSWRLPMDIDVTIYQGDARVAYTFWRDHYSFCYGSPTEPGLLRFFLERERAYQKELATRIEQLTYQLATSHSEEMQAYSHDQLGALAPERATEWDALYAVGMEALRAKQAARADAVRRLRMALDDRLAEVRLVRAYNDEFLAGLLNRLDREIEVREIEYLVMVDGGGATVADTLFVTGVDGDWYTVLDGDGRQLKWHLQPDRILRISEPYAVRPTTHPHLFESSYLYEFGPVRHLNEDGWLFAGYMKDILEMPAEVDWNVLSGGLPIDKEVEALLTAHRQAARPPQADPF